MVADLDLFNETSEERPSSASVNSSGAFSTVTYLWIIVDQFTTISSVMVAGFLENLEAPVNLTQTGYENYRAYRSATVFGDTGMNGDYNITITYS